MDTILLSLSNNDYEFVIPLGTHTALDFMFVLFVA